MSWIALSAAASHAQPLDSVRVLTLEDGRTGFWLPRAAALDYRDLLQHGLLRYEAALARYRARVRQDSLLIRALHEEGALLRRQLADLQALAGLYEAEVRTRAEAEALYAAAYRRQRWWQRGALAGAGALALLLLTR